MPDYRPLDWYDQAQFYDVIFDADTPRETDFLEAAHDRYALGRGRGGATRRVLEPACGSGRLLVALARRGWRATGFDRSEGMLRFARDRLREAGQRGRVLRADLSSFDLPGPYHLAHCLVSTIKHLPDDRAFVAHLRCVARSLASGGIYVLGLHLTHYPDREGARERWIARRGALRVTCTIESDPPDPRTRTEQVRARLVVTRGGAKERYESRWAFRTYGPRQLQRVLDAVPALEVVGAHGFDHRIDRPIRLFGDRLDTVLVLRRR